MPGRRHRTREPIAEPTQPCTVLGLFNSCLFSSDTFAVGRGFIAGYAVYDFEIDHDQGAYSFDGTLHAYVRDRFEDPLNCASDGWPWCHVLPLNNQGDVYGSVPYSIWADRYFDGSGSGGAP